MRGLPPRQGAHQGPEASTEQQRATAGEIGHPSECDIPALGLPARRLSIEARAESPDSRGVRPQYKCDLGIGDLRQRRGEKLSG